VHCAGSQSWAKIHTEAVAKGQNFYTDPSTGLMVMTELVHRSRGRCCGSGCRHCPFSHERVRPGARADMISQPAWLVAPKSPSTLWADTPSKQITVLFWSTGKDSFLALRALQQGWPVESVPCMAGNRTMQTITANENSELGHQADCLDDLSLLEDLDDADSVAAATECEARLALGSAANTTSLSLHGQATALVCASAIVLLTTFDAQSRRVAHQETEIRDAIVQAETLRLPLLGVPLHRGGPEYCHVIRPALHLIRTHFQVKALTLAFGDLHLAHVRKWREAAQLGEPEDTLGFPLWNVPYTKLLQELRASGAVARISAVTDMGQGVVAVGDVFTPQLSAHAAAAGIDAFGENGEFHTLVDLSQCQQSPQT
jgi:diphthamide synthase (EF-2-diphthine--ammonia ligase)